MVSPGTGDWLADDRIAADTTLSKALHRMAGRCEKYLA